MISKAMELSTFLRLKVDYFFPKHCLLCLNTGQKSAFCEACMADFPKPLRGCHICGEALHAPATRDNCSDLVQHCGQCLLQRPAYQYYRSAFNYAFPVNLVIQKLKYQEQGFWAAPLADSAWPAFREHFSGLNDARLIPVPMHKSQYRQRRDNHAELIARRLAAWAGLGVETGLVVKQQKTTRQAGLSGKARRRNLKHAFALNEVRKFPQSPLIIIDDVVTTGTTMDTIARLIRTRHDNEIYGFSLAKRSLND